MVAVGEVWSWGGGWRMRGHDENFVRESRKAVVLCPMPTHAMRLHEWGTRLSDGLLKGDCAGWLAGGLDGIGLGVHLCVEFRVLGLAGFVEMLFHDAACLDGVAGADSAEDLAVHLG